MSMAAKSVRIPLAPYAFAWTAAGGVHTCHAVAIDNSLGTCDFGTDHHLVTTPVSQGLKAEYFNNRFLATRLRSRASILP
jgi:hypothetical protein